jgi:tRNA threonylcarbamoyladenosine modification (KEOPS) complex Cgi121 subunit
MKKKDHVYKLGDTFTTIIAVPNIGVKSESQLIDDLRRISDVVHIQAVEPNIVYGINHILGILKVTLESERRNITFTNRIEMDFLLRLVCTDQISSALKYGGIKNGLQACFVIFSKDRKELLKVSRHVQKLFFIHHYTDNNSLLKPTEAKKKLISNNIGLTTAKIFDNRKFVKYLLERGALITRY